MAGSRESRNASPDPTRMEPSSGFCIIPNRFSREGVGHDRSRRRGAIRRAAFHSGSSDNSGLRNEVGRRRSHEGCARFDWLGRAKSDAKSTRGCAATSRDDIEFGQLPPHPPRGASSGNCYPLPKNRGSSTGLGMIGGLSNRGDAPAPRKVRPDLPASTNRRGGKLGWKVAVRGSEWRSGGGAAVRGIQGGSRLPVPEAKRLSAASD